MTKFVAYWEGKLVGTRKSDRPYTHAVVVQDDEAAARKHAYEYQPTKTDRSNFAYYQEIDRLGEQHPHYGVTSWRTEPDRAGIAEARAHLVGGFEGYVERIRQEQIGYFERAKKSGGFEPRVAGWSMSARNAEKMRSQQCGSFHSRTTHFLGIVPAVQAGQQVVDAAFDRR